MSVDASIYDQGVSRRKFLRRSDFDDLVGTTVGHAKTFFEGWYVSNTNIGFVCQQEVKIFRNGEVMDDATILLEGFRIEVVHESLMTQLARLPLNRDADRAFTQALASSGQNLTLIVRVRRHNNESMSEDIGETEVSISPTQTVLDLKRMVGTNLDLDASHLGLIHPSDPQDDDTMESSFIVQDQRESVRMLFFDDLSAMASMASQFHGSFMEGLFRYLRGGDDEVGRLQSKEHNIKVKYGAEHFTLQVPEHKTIGEVLDSVRGHSKVRDDDAEIVIEMAVIGGGEPEDEPDDEEISTAIPASSDAPASSDTPASSDATVPVVEQSGTFTVNYIYGTLRGSVQLPSDAKVAGLKGKIADQLNLNKKDITNLFP